MERSEALERSRGDSRVEGEGDGRFLEGAEEGGSGREECV